MRNVQGPTDLVMQVDRGDGEATVTVSGEVDLSSSTDLRTCLRETLGEFRRVVVDLGGLTFIDSSGLSALVDAHRTARASGGVVVLRDPPALLRRLLAITSLDSLLVLDPPATPSSAPSTDGRG